jgi:hypothetical protein
LGEIDAEMDEDVVAEAPVTDGEEQGGEQGGELGEVGGATALKNSALTPRICCPSS